MISTDYLNKCIDNLTYSFDLLAKQARENTDYEVYRLAVIKEFEIIIEQAHKLLRKILLPYMPSRQALDKLNFKEVFRSAGKHGLLTIDEVERWCIYRDNRNALAHDYGFNLAEQTLPLIPNFIKDNRSLVGIINNETKR